MFKNLVMTILLVSMTFSCTSMKNVEFDNNQIIASIGDVVELTTLKGKSYKFTVETITPEQIGGDGFLFSLKDVLEIKKEQFSVPLTIISAVGVVFLALAIAFNSGDCYICG
jgi:hypothetical protein